MSSIDFDELYKQRKEKLKYNKKPVISYVTNNVPIELLSTIADTIPWTKYVEFFKSKKSKPQAQVLPVDFCDYVKQCCAISYEEERPEVLCIVAATTCGPVLRMLEHLGLQEKVYLMDIPRVQDKSSGYIYWKNQVKNLKQYLEEISGQAITSEKLYEEIKLRNKIDNKITGILELRKKENKVIDACKARSIYLSKFNFQANECLGILEDVHKCTVKALEEKPKVSNKKYIPRVLLAGPITLEILSGDDANSFIPLFLKTVENCGASIVIEESYRHYINDDVDKNATEDMLMDLISRQYYDMNLSAYQVPNDKRVTHLKNLAKEFQVDGVIYCNLRFCDVFGYEVGIIEKTFKESGIPFLRLEIGAEDMREGQLSIRLEPFIDILKYRQYQKN